MSRDSITDSGNMFVSCSQISDQPPCSLTRSPGAPSSEYSNRGLNLTIHHHLVSKLKIWWNYTSNSTYSTIVCRVSTNTSSKIWTVYIVSRLII